MERILCSILSLRQSQQHDGNGAPSPLVQMPRRGSTSMLADFVWQPARRTVSHYLGCRAQVKDVSSDGSVVRELLLNTSLAFALVDDQEPGFHMYDDPCKGHL